jgi:hypothetical protein
MHRVAQLLHTVPILDYICRQNSAPGDDTCQTSRICVMSAHQLSPAGVLISSFPHNGHPFRVTVQASRRTDDGDRSLRVGMAMRSASATHRRLVEPHPTLTGAFAGADMGCHGVPPLMSSSSRSPGTLKCDRQTLCIVWRFACRVGARTLSMRTTFYDALSLGHRASPGPQRKPPGQ